MGLYRKVRNCTPISYLITWKYLMYNNWYNFRPKFLINNLDFHCRFKYITSGNIIVVKKLSPNMFVGQIENDELYDVLEMMSKNIESSELINA